MQVYIQLEKIRHNAAVIRGICRQAHLQPVWITKGCNAFPPILDVLAEDGRDMLGDVSQASLERARGAFSGRLMMAQLPDKGRVPGILPFSDVWLVSAPVHAQTIAAAARQLDKRQDLILMVDVGNRREGVMPGQVTAIAEAIRRIEAVSLTGLGTSVGCYGGYRAGRTDMEQLVAVARQAETDLKCRFEVLSAGSGTMLLDLATRGDMPPRINQLRIGAAVLVGEIPPTKTALPDLYQDAFIFRGEVLETAPKPSMPACSTGVDAFGRKIVFEDLGLRQLSLLNFGLLDVDSYDLTPLDKGLRILGATSNYTLCDTTRCERSLEIGDTLDFRMAYSAMARAMASERVAKVAHTHL